MKKKPVVSIENYYDGFSITVNGKRFHIDQEDTQEILVDMFKELGIDATYEECY